MPQPTSKPGQLGGNHGPTRPTNFPVAFSSTTNMPAPCSAQCPAITAALRHPADAVVTGLPSTVMYRAVPGSASIAVFGSTSAPHHCRSFSRSVSMTGPFGWVSVMPGLSGGNIGFSILSIFLGKCLPPSLRGAQATKKSRLTLLSSGLLRRACHRAALCADPLARNDVVALYQNPACYGFRRSPGRR
jgi:hypothetical protein